MSISLTVVVVAIGGLLLVALAPYLLLFGGIVLSLSAVVALAVGDEVQGVTLLTFGVVIFMLGATLLARREDARWDQLVDRASDRLRH
jgi:membrane protein implicated in regulation of membrane protease activity